MSKNTKSPRKGKGVGNYLSNVVYNVSDSVTNTGKAVLSPITKRLRKPRSQYVAKVKGSKKTSKPRSKVVKRKLRSVYAKKVRKTRSDKGVKRGPRKAM
jgi:hypothetical protein